MPKVAINTDATLKWRLSEIFFRVIETHPTMFNADTIWNAAARVEFPPTELARLLPAQFRSFQAAGIIKKLPVAKLSQRNNSSLLACWSKRDVAANATDKAALVGCKSANGTKGIETNRFQDTSAGRL